jgi:hypothetical protein
LLKSARSSGTRRIYSTLKSEISDKIKRAVLSGDSIDNIEFIPIQVEIESYNARLSRNKHKFINPILPKDVDRMIKSAKHIPKIERERLLRTDDDIDIPRTEFSDIQQGTSRGHRSSGARSGGARPGGR